VAQVNDWRYGPAALVNTGRFGPLAARSASVVTQINEVAILRISIAAFPLNDATALYTAPARAGNFGHSTDG